ncbi:hypothetical protein LZG74_04505 [Dyadobacter sp. CY327]|uniref:DUF6934 family protein n=1 Tax=Dyadobacter sp. CY327 TaxID=2907301 RepID=UPI001F1FCCC0|nr:hypothetical protein [Dyadobacter sp. CY327]MCE7069546.1 hypothetical protein [Dyadobacter sp. CY327]
MQYEAYPFVLNEAETHYKFESIGKRGVIEKAISFSKLSIDVYNLALLDFDPVTQNYIDDSVTDNGDMPEIMATVIAVILNYLNEHPARRIVLTGNSKSRNRLYQIAIGKVWEVVQEDLQILGFNGVEWLTFEPNGSFESFLIARKFLIS